MKSGFKEVVDKILRKYGLKTRDCIGTVWADGDINWKILQSMGYRIEQGINRPDYDYVILSKEKSTLSNLLLALTRTKLGCIIIFSGDALPFSDVYRLIKSTGASLSYYNYGERKASLGVIFKGKEI